MKNKKNLIWGIVWIAVGIFVGLAWFDVIHVDVFFDGWWTLFIIVPGVVGLITEKDKAGNIAAICIGVVFLLWQQDVLSLDLLWKIVVPIAIVAFGIKMIARAFTSDGSSKRKKVSDAPTVKEEEFGDCPEKRYVCVFGGDDVNLADERVKRIKCVAVFGGADLDLRNAIFDGDCDIHVACVFGGVDIKLPDGVKVDVNSVSLFGGVDHEESKNAQDGNVTVHIHATCIFGGVEVL